MRDVRNSSPEVSKIPLNSPYWLQQQLSVQSAPRTMCGAEALHDIEQATVSFHYYRLLYNC
jgi:hypothetical protein